MKFGVSYNTGAYGVVDPDAMIAVARHAEACGFESFYVPEHVASLSPTLKKYFRAAPVEPDRGPQQARRHARPRSFHN